MAPTGGAAAETHEGAVADEVLLHKNIRQGPPAAACTPPSATWLLGATRPKWRASPPHQGKKQRNPGNLGTGSRNNRPDYPHGYGSVEEILSRNLEDKIHWVAEENPTAASTKEG